MCRIEYYNVVFPDGSVEQKERTLHCNRGTPSSYCPELTYHEAQERLATTEETTARDRPDLHTITPRSEAESRGHRKAPPQGLRLGFKSWNPFKKSHKKKDFFFARKRDQTELKYRPTTPRPRTPSPEPRSLPPRIVPIRPKPSGHYDSKEVPPKPKRRPAPVEIHNPKGKGPTSPLDPGREHHKPFSPIKTDAQRAYEREKEERRQNDSAREQQEAQDRARRHHNKERQRPQEEIWERRQQQQRRRSYDARPDPGETYESMMARQRQRERDIERLQAADRRQAERDREHERHARHQREDEEVEQEETQRREERRGRRRRQEDEDRRARRRDVGIPRQPRHPTTVHNTRNRDPQDFDEQGSDWIADATRTADRRSAERRAPPTAWDRPQRGRDGLWRRNTVDGSQREETNGRRKRSHKRQSHSD